MKLHTETIIALLIAALVFSSGVFNKHSYAVSRPQESSQQEPTATTIKIVDGFFHHLDLEKKQMLVAIDKQGKILQSINLGRIKSVYLIQGKPEKLKGLLAGGSIGAIVGFSSLFWKSLTDPNKDATDNQKDNKLNITDLAIRIGGGAGVGLIIGYFRDRGEESIRPFPVYDPEIRQTNPHPSIDFGNIENLAKMLREKESFVHVTLKEKEEK